MPITFMKGDLFDVASQRTDLHAIAFGADTAGALSSGIANTFRTRWPAFAEAYRAHCQSTKAQLGDVFTWREGNLVMYALVIQREDNKPTIAAFDRATSTMVKRATEDNVQGILLPRVGSGKEGLDWLRVKRILNDASATTPTSFIVFEQFVRAGAKGEGAPPAAPET